MGKIVKKGTKQAAATKQKKLTVTQAAAANINEVLAPKPLLDVTASDADLSKELIELLPSIAEGDELDLATWKVLKGLGWGASNSAKAPKAAKAEKAGKTAKAPKVEKNPKLKIVVDEDKAPKREGTKAFARFAAYRKAKTVGNYEANGGKYSDISFDLYHKKITLA